MSKPTNTALALFATPILRAQLRMAVRVAASSRPVTCELPHLRSRSSCCSARNCGPVRPAVPREVGHPHGHVVPSPGGSGRGPTIESRAALCVPMAKADPVAGIAPLLETPAVAEELPVFRLPMFMLPVVVVPVLIVPVLIVLVPFVLVESVPMLPVVAFVPVLVPALVVPELVPVIGFVP